MADRPTDHATDHRPTDHGPVSLEEAAERFGVTVNAVRQRMKRGTLGGHKTPAGWVVAWPPTKATDRPTDRAGAIDATWSATDRPTTDQEPTDRPPAPVSGAARSQLAAIWDEWLAPLTARNEELARENGRLVAELAAVEGERDRLRAERDSDRLLADRLVDLLQAERDEARARVTELEGSATTEATAGVNGHSTPYGAARRRDLAPVAPDAGVFVALAGGGVSRFLRLIKGGISGGRMARHASPGGLRSQRRRGGDDRRGGGTGHDDSGADHGDGG